jgi:hypothetical protein
MNLKIKGFLFKTFVNFKVEKRVKKVYWSIEIFSDVKKTVHLRNIYTTQIQSKARLYQ